MSTKSLRLQPYTRKATPVATSPVTPVVNSFKEKKVKTRVEELMLEMSISG